MNDVKVVGQRVDAITLAYRVRLDPELVDELATTAKLARKHGRAALSWWMRVPDDDGDGTIGKRSRIGTRRGVAARWADEVDGRVLRERRTWGELRYSRAMKRYLLVNEPVFRVLIDEHAAGDGELVECRICFGDRVLSDGEPCPACGASGLVALPAWTVEIVWYAEELARLTEEQGSATAALDVVLRESAALASNLGDVFASRLRRIDLCADVAGWQVESSDVRRIVKRPRAKWEVRDDADAFDKRKPQERARDDGAAVFGKGPTLAKRRVTGIMIGFGGDMSARLYDKRSELEKEDDTTARRRDDEEARWRARGWDGVSPVTRVEFQIRGSVLDEMGIRDPDAVVTPEYRWNPTTDARGRLRYRRVVTSYIPLYYSPEHDTFTAVRQYGDEVQATLIHRLGSVWATCLDWVRLVVPRFHDDGRPYQPRDLDDDPRWAILRKVRFSDAEQSPMKRQRIRTSASAAQLLGCALSSAARKGQLPERAQDRKAYPDDERGVLMLRRIVFALMLRGGRDVVRWLLERWGSPAAALEHLAVVSNGKRARWAWDIERRRRAIGPPELAAA